MNGSRHRVARMSTVRAHLSNLDLKNKDCCVQQVDLKEIVSTGRFDMAKAQRAAGWLQSLIADGPVVPETEEYGISSFIYRCLLVWRDAGFCEKL